MSKLQNSNELNFHLFNVTEIMTTFLLKFLYLSGAEVCTSCRSRQELSNEYFLAKFGFDTAENESSKVCSYQHPTILPLGHTHRSADSVAFSADMSRGVWIANASGFGFAEAAGNDASSSASGTFFWAFSGTLARHTRNFVKRVIRVTLNK